MNRVHPMRSLGAKLFYLMSGLVLLTIAGSSFQSGQKFREIITRSIQDQTLQTAEVAASEIGGRLEGWIAQLSVGLSTMRGIAQNDALGELRNFVTANKDFIAAQVFLQTQGGSPRSMTFAFTGNTSDPRFDRSLPGDVRGKLQSSYSNWVTAIAPDASRNFWVRSEVSSAGIQALTLAIRFPLDGSNEKLWAVLTGWHTPLIGSLPKTRNILGSIVDKDGKVFASPISEYIQNLDSLKRLPLTKTAIKGKSNSGFRGEFKDQKGRSWFGSFAKVRGFEDLTVIIQADARTLWLVTKETLVRTALWASLFILIAVMLSYVMAGGLTRQLREVTVATKRIAEGDFKARIKPGAQDEVGLLSHSINIMSARIEQLLSSQVEKARFEKELETARMVQSTFFPRTDVRRGPLFVTGMYQPASECGGDLWGHFAVDEGIDVIFIADAMGHGAPAALVTAIAYSTCMTVADLLKERSISMAPGSLLERVNRIVFEAVRGSISMTFFVMVIDSRKGEIIYANAGHNFPMIVPAKAHDPRIKKRSKSLTKVSFIQPITLNLKGVPLGIEADAKFNEQRIALEPGDKIFLYTDGLVECESPTGETLGKKVLTEHVAMLALEPADAIKTQVMAQASEFFAGTPPKDDITIVVAEINADWKPSEKPAVETSSDGKPSVGLTPEEQAS